MAFWTARVAMTPCAGSLLPGVQESIMYHPPLPSGSYQNKQLHTSNRYTCWIGTNETMKSDCGKVLFLVILLVTSVIIFTYYVLPSVTMKNVYPMWIRRHRSKCDTQRFHYNFANNETFKPVSGDGVYTFHGICIEKLDPGSTQGRRLVVYNSSNNETLHVQVKSGRYITHPYWIIQLSTSSIPSNNSLLQTPAFFVQSTCEGNLHHLFEDLLVGLYGTLKATHWLGNPFVVYPSSPVLTRDRNCHNSERFRPMMSAFRVQRYEWYQYETPGTCYSNAVFGFVFNNTQHGEMEEYIVSKLNVTPQCPPKLITIIQRSSSRKILNINEIKTVIMQIDTSLIVNVRSLEMLTLHEQVQIGRCSKVLIGVQGAGLQWYSFMTSPAGVLEITWTGWPPLYSSLARDKCYVARHICGQPTINWTMIEDHFRLKPLTASEKESHIKRSESILFLDNHNVWKWADVEVNIANFQTAITALLDDLTIWSE